MISIGGVIGAGLFVSSSTSILRGGPASFLSYAICGLLILLVMRMLGEMATALPNVRSFTEFARAGLAAARCRVRGGVAVLVLLGTGRAGGGDRGRQDHRGLA